MFHFKGLGSHCIKHGYSLCDVTHRFHSVVALAAAVLVVLPLSISQVTCQDVERWWS